MPTFREFYILMFRAHHEGREVKAGSLTFVLRGADWIEIFEHGRSQGCYTMSQAFEIYEVEE